uniref:Uncharacterized protein n=1 Tax=Oryza meridionalis TaxID=40149 RepID=A0A0E0EZH1_9ORYZ
MPPASIPTSCKSGEVDLGMEEVGGVEELATLESARRRSGVCRWRRLQYEAASASFLPMGGRFDERAARYKNDLDFYFMESWKSCIPGSAVTEG